MHRLRRHLQLSVTCCTMFFLPLMITGMSVLNPIIAVETGVGYSLGQWVLNAFMVCFAAFMAVTGAAVDTFGHRKVFAVGIIVLIVSSLAISLIPNIWLIISLRSIAGIAAAATTTASTAIVAHRYQAGERQWAFTIFGTSLGLGLALGPLFAGVVADLLGTWRAFFAIIGLGLLLPLFGLPLLSKGNEQRSDTSAQKIDLAGGVLFTLALGTTVTVFSAIPVFGFLSIWVLVLTAIAFAFWLGFIVVENTTATPLIEMSLLRNREFLTYCITAVFLGFGYISLLFYLPQFLSVSGNLSSVDVGMSLTFATLPSLVLPPAISFFRTSDMNWLLLRLTYVFLGLGALALAFVVKSPTSLSLMVPMLILGSSFGISLAYLDGGAVSAVTTDKSGIAAGVFNTFRLGGEAIMIPAMGFIIATFLQSFPGISKISASYLLQGNIGKAETLLDLPRYDLVQYFNLSIRSTLVTISIISLFGLVSIYLLRSSKPCTGYREIDD